MFCLEHLLTFNCVSGKLTKLHEIYKKDFVEIINVFLTSPPAHLFLPHPLQSLCLFSPMHPASLLCVIKVPLHLLSVTATQVWITNDTPHCGETQRASVWVRCDIITSRTRHINLFSFYPVRLQHEKTTSDNNIKNVFTTTICIFIFRGVMIKFKGTWTPPTI